VDEVKRWVAAALVAVAALLALAAPAGAQAGSDLTIAGSIDGRDIDTADSDDPIELDPEALIPIQVTIRNEGEQEERIRYVRLEGKALGLTFLTYDLGVRAVLGPQDRTEVDTVLDFFDLESQATGYLGTSIRVYDDEGFLIGEKKFVVDVLGRPSSTLGSFAVIVFALAVFSISVIVVNTIRRRLPSNRFVRACQFAMAGSALGITLSLGVSIMRIGFADVDDWVGIVLTPTAIAFAIGYLAPGPLQRSIKDYQAEEVLTAAAQVAVARSTGANPEMAEELLRSLQQGPLRMSTGGRGTGRSTGRGTGRRTGRRTGRGTSGSTDLGDRNSGSQVPEGRGSGSQAPTGRNSGSQARNTKPPGRLPPDDPKPWRKRR
jgi:hypothetical protein